MVGSWFKRWRTERTLQRRAIPDTLWQLTLARFPFLQLPGADDARLRELSTLFLASKEFTGVDSLEIDDTMAVAIAAQACLPVLHLGLECYDGFVGIVVHEDAVAARREVVDDDGVVHQYDEELSGEAMHGGAMPQVDVDVDARAPREDDGSSLAADLATVAGHDHCANAALLRWRDVALTAPSTLVSVDVASGSVPFTPSHVGPAGTVVYLIAPKTSPPDRSV